MSDVRIVYSETVLNETHRCIILVCFHLFRIDYFDSNIFFARVS